MGQLLYLRYNNWTYVMIVNIIFFIKGAIEAYVDLWISLNYKHCMKISAWI
jgi:hypothetical protein